MCSIQIKILLSCRFFATNSEKCFWIFLIQKRLYRFFRAICVFFFVNCWLVVAHGYFFHKPSTKSSLGDNFCVFEIFCRKKITFFFWIRLTGERTSKVTSGTSGDHLLVTSVTKKMSGLLGRVTSENPWKKNSSSLVGSSAIKNSVVVLDISLGVCSCPLFVSKKKLNLIQKVLCPYYQGGWSPKLCFKTYL